MSAGRRIKKRRLELNLSAGELAERIGKDRSTVYRYESGDISKITIDMLFPLAEALETTPAYILGMDSPEANPAKAGVINVGQWAAYASSNEAIVKNMRAWIDEMGQIEFTEDEHQQIIDFAKYLLFKRSLGHGIDSP